MLGLIGRKLGMTQVFNEAGNVIPVTVLKIDTNYVIGARSEEKNGYKAVIIGSVPVKESRVTKPYIGQFKEGIKPTKYLCEIRDFEKEYKMGDTFGVDVFEDISYIDVKAVSKGKGYQGTIKRHGFGGGRKSHGSKFHRTPGSIKMTGAPSKSRKGKKMAGRMGADMVTVHNLQVVRVDKEQGVLLVKGAVPGRNDAFILISKAKKK